MSTTVCSYNYEYNGQVHSPAFSDPPSPKDYNPDSEEDGCGFDDSNLSPPMSPHHEDLSSKHVNKTLFRLQESSMNHPTTKTNSQLQGMPSTKDLWKNKLKRKNSEGDAHCGNHTTTFSFVNKKPKYPTKYHEMLQPLSPVTSFPPTNVPTLIDNVKQNPTIKEDVQLQKQFDLLIDDSIAINEKEEKLNEHPTQKVEEFLISHSKIININRYNGNGQTPLQRCCSEGNLPLAKLLVKFGAKSKLTTRDGFSTLHIAAFSGHSHMLFYIMNIKS